MGWKDLSLFTSFPYHSPFCFPIILNKTKPSTSLHALLVSSSLASLFPSSSWAKVRLTAPPIFIDHGPILAQATRLSLSRKQQPLCFLNFTNTRTFAWFKITNHQINLHDFSFLRKKYLCSFLFLKSYKVIFITFVDNILGHKTYCHNIFHITFSI